MCENRDSPAFFLFFSGAAGGQLHRQARLAPLKNKKMFITAKDDAFRKLRRDLSRRDIPTIAQRFSVGFRVESCSRPGDNMRTGS